VRRFSLLAFVAIACAVPLAAFERPLDRRALEEALNIGQTGIEQIRTRFHAAYRFEAAGRAPVDYVEIVTPFRSVVLAAETRYRIGDRAFGLREAQEVANAAGDEVRANVELTFHPHNTFIFVPEYDVWLATPNGPVAEAQPALVIDRLPRYGPRLEGFSIPMHPTSPVRPGKSQPLTGGVLVSHFDATKLDPRGVYDVVVGESEDKKPKELARVRVDFARLR
jgi:hypothetical protein